MPRIRYVSWQAGERAEHSPSLCFFGNLWLAWHEKEPRPSGLCSLARVFRGPDTAEGPLALRFLATYVPRLSEGEGRKPVYQALSEEAKEAKAGDIKTFEHLAADALEATDEEGEFKGQPLLAVLKADVDRLGMVFGLGLEDPTVSRLASLSRMMDLFFTGYLYEFLRSNEEFRSAYTVYAGGDDLLLIGPWRQMAGLAVELRRKFAEWTGHNENITLSAGLELMKVNHPINRVAREAEARLERAKGGGKNRICAIEDEPVSWEEFTRQMEASEKLYGYLKQGVLSQVFVHRILEFDRQRRQVEGRAATDAKPREIDLSAAGWRSRWGYQLARHVRDNKAIAEVEKDTISRFLNGLVGLDAGLQRTKEDPSPRIAVSVTLYRNRKVTERR